MNIKGIVEFVIGAVLLTSCAAPKAADAPSPSVEETTSVQAEQITPVKRTVDPSKPVMALTFDDGPNTTVTPRVLDALEKYDAVGTFFLIGDNINDESTEQVRRAYGMGCEIASHSLTHSYMDKMSEDEIKAEMSETSKRIKNIIGVEPVFFRPPYIAVSPTMYQAIDMPFICGKGVNDWESSTTKEQRIDGVLNAAEDGAIILLHDFGTNYATAMALDSIISGLQEQGYQLVTVSELFEAKGKDPHSDEFRNKVISVVK